MPMLIIVRGLPGTGKTTLARELGAQLGLPLMTKDGLKEILFATLGWRDREWSRRLSLAAIMLLYQFAEAHLIAGRSCIIESNFRTSLGTADLRGLDGIEACALVQIILHTDDAVLVERLRARHASGERHPGHGGWRECLVPDPEDRADHYAPFPYPGKVIHVDTTQPHAVDYAVLCERIQAAGHCPIAYTPPSPVRSDRL